MTLAIAIMFLHSFAIGAIVFAFKKRQKHRMSLQIGSISLANNVALAPMSGVSDLPFRRVAAQLGTGLVVSEMVASDALAQQRPDMVRRAEADRLVSPFVIQLAGRDPQWMAKGVELAQAAGADIVDINMGCPARQVTGALSGSSLMRDPDRALALVDAVCQAATKPVTLKMRLGWNDQMRNAPYIAQRAYEAGVQMFTVHGRTRCQFYKGQADWEAVRETVNVVPVPVLVNGDILGLDDAITALKQSGAAGVMIGRGAVGQPWLPGAVAAALKSGAQAIEVPSLEQQADTAVNHYRHIIAHYGEPLGVRVARKHLAAYIEHAATGFSYEEKRRLRSGICQLASPSHVEEALVAYYTQSSSVFSLAAA